MGKKKSLAYFSRDSRLYKAEIAFIKAVEKGEDFTPDAALEDAERFVRGGLIRAMLLSAPLKHHPDADVLSGPRPVRMTPHGIRIVRAPSVGGKAVPMLRIVQSLNLAGMAAEGGDYLPALGLSNCLFEQRIQLDGCHLQSLTLVHSRFVGLSAVGANFNNNVLLAFCRPPSDPRDAGERYFRDHELAVHEGDECGFVSRGLQSLPAGAEVCSCPDCVPGAPARACSACCVIDFSSAAVIGSFLIAHCHLRAPGIAPRTYAVPRFRDAQAANLHGLHVRDSLRIRRTTCFGAVSLANIEVGDDVWIVGGGFYASADRPTFDLQHARIGGVLTFQALPADSDAKAAGIRAFPVAVVGQIAGIGLHAGEIWIGEGYYFGHNEHPGGAFPTINFAKSDVAHSVKFGAYHEHHVTDPLRPTGEVRIHGEICLRGLDIGKSLELHGVGFEGIVEAMKLEHGFFANFGVRSDEPCHLKLTGHGLKVDRRIYIAHTVLCDSGETDAAPASAQGDGARTVPAALDLWKSTIGTGLRIQEQCSFTGAIRVNSCVIGREMIVGCWLIKPVPAAGDAGKAIPYLVDVSESTIKGHFRIGRHEPRAVPEATVAGAPDTVVTVRGGITLESANVQGSILLGHVTFDLGAFALPEVAGGQCMGTGKGSEIEEKRIALNLRDCVCGSDLEVHSLHWRLPGLTAGETAAIDDPPRGFDRLRAARQGRRFRAIALGSFALIDLRGLHCGLLIDGFGAEWGLIYRLRLRLAGIKIGDVEPASHKAPHARTGRPELARLRWLAFQNCRQRVVGDCNGNNDGRCNGDDQAPAPVTLLERCFCAREEDFVPQAYDVFSTAYRRAGEDRTAEHILIEKKNVENAVRFQRIWRLWRRSVWRWLPLALQALVIAILTVAVTYALLPRPLDGIAIGTIFVAIGVLLWPCLVSILQMSFRFGFRYGLSVQSGMIFCCCCILVGTAGVYWARNGGPIPVSDWAAAAPGGVLADRIVLVLDVDYEPTYTPPIGNTVQGAAAPAAPAATGQVPRDGGARRMGEAVYAGPSPCNLDVNSLLYAVDVFIPLIDLDQERRCKVRDALPASGVDDYAWWRIVKALYELVGWIVISLVILTITGVLRRDLER